VGGERLELSCSLCYAHPSLKDESKINCCAVPLLLAAYCSQAE